MARRDPLVYLFLGCLLAVAAVFVPRGRPRVARGPVVWWVADRDAGRVVGLNERLGIELRVPLRHPLALAPAPDGGAWVLHALAGGPRGPCGLSLVGREGSLDRCARFEAAVGLASAASEALVLAREPGPVPGLRLWSHDGSEPRPLGSFPPGTRLFGREGRAWLAFRDGRVHELGRAPLRDVCAASGDPLVAFACEDEGAYGLFADPPRVVRHDRDGRALWSRPLDFPADRLVLDGRPGRVWAADSWGREVWLLGPSGERIVRRGLVLPGVETGARHPAGGVLLAVAGALLRFDGRSNVAPGQGGFEYVAALIRASESAP